MTCGSIKWLRGIAATEQGWLCYHCRKHMTKPGEELPTSCTAEHLIPVAHGGRNSRENVVAACLKCNADKADQLMAKRIDRTKKEIHRVRKAGLKQQARTQMWREEQVMRAPHFDALATDKYLSTLTPTDGGK